MNNYMTHLQELRNPKLMDVDKTPLADAQTFALDEIPDLYKIIPNFDKNYAKLQKEVMKGKYKRKQMPVIRSDDYSNFQEYLLSKGIKNKIQKLVADNINPSQRQIYLAQIIKNIKKNGFNNTMDWITNKSLFIVSKDGFIIDGHHRFATAILLNPLTKVRGLVVDLNQAELLKIALHFSDKVANNTRNEGIRDDLN